MRVVAMIFLLTITLVFGAVAGYVYRQAEIVALDRQITSLEADLAQADGNIATTTRELQSMKVELAARMKLADEQQARIIELEAAQANANPPPPVEQPAEQPAAPDTASVQDTAPILTPPLPPVRP